MKKVIFFIFAAIFAVSCGTAIQITDSNKEVNNFVYNSGSVSWSKVYEFNASDADAVKDWFHQNFKITKDGDKSIIGESNQNALPIEEAGYSRMSVIMLLTHPCVVYFTTDFKEDRFRVIVNRIIWSPQVGITTYGVTQGVGNMNLNEIALKNGGYSSVFYNTTSVQLDKMLNYMFTPRLNQASNDDNW